MIEIFQLNAVELHATIDLHYRLIDLKQRKENASVKILPSESGFEARMMFLPAATEERTRRRAR